MADDRELARLNRPLTWAAGSLARWNPPGTDEEYSGGLRRLGQQNKQDVEARGLRYSSPAAWRSAQRDRAAEIDRMLNSEPAGTDMRDFLLEAFSEHRPEQGESGFTISRGGQRARVPDWITDAWLENPDWDVEDMKRFLHSRGGPGPAGE